MLEPDVSLPQFNSISWPFNFSNNINCYNLQASTKNSISDSEKREKKMLEKKLSEMEEELKVCRNIPGLGGFDDNSALYTIIPSTNFQLEKKRKLF